MNLSEYNTDDFYDEMFQTNLKPRNAYSLFYSWLQKTTHSSLLKIQHSTDRTQLTMGMTFNVYSGEGAGKERILPLDIIPRIIDSQEWKKLEAGLKQRIYALNLFINDIYHEQKILKDKVIPSEIIYSSPGFLRPCIGLNPPFGTWCHITGTDLVRHSDGNFYVLEDNLRCPSGVSYMLENREILKRTFPSLFEKLNVQLIYDYPFRLLAMLQHISGKENPTVAILTPGIYNSAYFEHSYLAQQMGVELVEGIDLITRNNQVFMQTTKGLKKVDVIYRRIDDTFLDPLAFNPNSMLGVKGLFEAYKNGNIALANAPGTGIADDKVIYAYVPRIIKYYLNEEPIIPNVPTYICSEEKDLKYVLENTNELVVKEANAAGGYGMLIGPKSSKEEIENFREKIKENPRNYIAQPVISLSRVPTVTEKSIEGRHVDLRPFILYGKEINVIPGGLTRVALKKDSLVVNSSQGGGSKDTWVL
jgi:uncharacterized circularly permuted ATP-grasp superfamily protein